MPIRALWVQKPPSAFETGTGIEHPVERVVPVIRKWSPDGAGNVKVNRSGFLLVPDFSGTIHRNVEF